MWGRGHWPRPFSEKNAIHKIFDVRELQLINHARFHIMIISLKGNVSAPLAGRFF